MTLLPLTEYQLSKLLPKQGPVFIKPISNLPFKLSFDYSNNLAIYCNPDSPCGFVHFSHSETEIVLSDTIGNQIFRVIPTKEFGQKIWNIESSQFHRVGYLVKQFSLFQHRYVIYNAYENRIALFQSAKISANNFNLFSPKYRIQGSLSKKDNQSKAILLDGNTEETEQPKNWIQSERALLIISSAIISQNHFLI
ncbi:hypothetical protein EP331_14720 [bacterium]|nr:MAG: hypothetical protein EP331_14720 [bacterium]